MARTIDVAESRTYPIAPGKAYGIVAPIQLPDLFSRGYLALPAIRGVQGQTGPEWGTESGHTRTIVLADGGTLQETIVAVDPPHSFRYGISRITGPMRPLVSGVEGSWHFASDGPGTRITWAWKLEPRAWVLTPVVAVVGLMWHGYARRALDRLAEVTAA